MPTDDQIEREIRDKGLTAPRVTPDSIEAKIKGEFYFTAMDGAEMARERNHDLEYPDPTGPLPRLTICILELENGFTILGKSASASASNFDPELGKKIARADAFNQIWPLEGYLLRERLFEDSMIIATQIVEDPLDGAGVPGEVKTAELIGGSVEADAVYRFAGWLTSRDEVVTASAKHDAAPMAQLVDQFLNQPKPPLGATVGVQ